MTGLTFLRVRPAVVKSHWEKPQFWTREEERAKFPSQRREEVRKVDFGFSSPTDVELSTHKEGGNIPAKIGTEIDISLGSVWNRKGTFNREEASYSAVLEMPLDCLWSGNRCAFFGHATPESGLVHLLISISCFSSFWLLLFRKWSRPIHLTMSEPIPDELLLLSLKSILILSCSVSLS